MATKLYTTAEAAKLAEVSRPTIQYWIATRKLKAPGLRIHNRRAARLWTAAAVEQMRVLAKTLKPGPSPKRQLS